MTTTPRYVDAAEVSAAIVGRVNDQYTADDPAIARAIKAAERRVDRYTRRRFDLAAPASTRVFRSTASDVLDIDDIGSLADLVVSTGRPGTWTDLVVDTGYFLEPIGALDQGEPINLLRSVNWWPTRTPWPTVQVTARWGWPEVPDDVAVAAQLLAIRLFKRRESPEGVAGFGDMGAVRLSRTDPDVAEMLDSYRMPPAVA